MTVSLVPQVKTGNAFYFTILVFNMLKIIFYFSLCVLGVGGKKKNLQRSILSFYLPHGSWGWNLGH